MKNFTTAHSSLPSATAAVEEIIKIWGDVIPSLIVFFASTVYNLEEIGKGLKQHFPEAEVMGCTTAGELISGQMLKNSVVAMSLSKTAVPRVHLEVIEDMTNGGNVPRALAGFEEVYRESMATMAPTAYVGLVLVDGLCVAEEKLIDKIGDRTNVLFVGGSAGDDLKFKATYVFANNRAYTNAAVLALLKPDVPFEILKTQSFCNLNKKLVATKVDEDKRQVLEFNGQPALKAYSEALDLSEEEAKDKFMSNPVGLLVNDEPFVRSPQQVKGESMIFYCSVLKNSELTLLQSMNIVDDTQAALQAKIKEMGSVSAILNFHCILRTLELEAEHQTQAYADLFKDIPTAGFSTYGEIYLGHINQTSTMLLFK
jgi:hypothetical protein